MTEFRRSYELARTVQSMGCSRDWPSNDTRKGKVSMQSFNQMSNRVLAAVSAFAVSAVFFAAAIVPASPAGILV